MKIISKNLSSTIISAAVTLLNAAVPSLSPKTLLSAIRAYQEDDSTKARSKRLYRIKEVCELLMVTRQSVYNLINSEKLVRIKIGAATRITADSLESFIDGSTE